MAATMITRANAEALIDMQVRNEIIDGIVRESKALRLLTRLSDMTSNKTKLRILDALGTAYWVDGEVNNGRKGVTNMAWANKYINAEELAVIVPIKEDVLADASFDIWGEVKKRAVEMFGKKIDQAIFFGTNKPSGFRQGLVPSIVAATKQIAKTSNLYSDIDKAMAKVEESGYIPNKIAGPVAMRSKFRNLLDTTGQPIVGTEIGELVKDAVIVDNGAWDSSVASLIVGDFKQAVYAIRQDITYKILDQAIIQDPETGDQLYNLAQEDMVALRITMRLGWEIPNPVNALDDTATRFPFASVGA